MGLVLLDNKNTKASLSNTNSKDNDANRVSNDPVTPDTTIIGGWATLPPNAKHIAERAYYQGYKDFLRGVLDNPFHKNSVFAKEWQRGQNAAYFKNKQFLDERRLVGLHLRVRKKVSKKAVTKPGK